MPLRCVTCETSSLSVSLRCLRLWWKWLFDVIVIFVVGIVGLCRGHPILCRECHTSCLGWNSVLRWVFVSYPVPHVITPPPFLPFPLSLFKCIDILFRGLKLDTMAMPSHHVIDLTLYHCYSGSLSKEQPHERAADWPSWLGWDHMNERHEKKGARSGPGFSLTMDHVLTQEFVLCDLPDIHFVFCLFPTKVQIRLLGW